MRGAFGKPQGTVARVRIGQPLMSVRTHDKHKAAVIEALRRTKFKFPGRQKVLYCAYVISISILLFIMMLPIVPSHCYHRTPIAEMFDKLY